jgi:alpha-galactosidase
LRSSFLLKCGQRLALASRTGAVLIAGVVLADHHGTAASSLLVTAGDTSVTEDRGRWIIGSSGVSLTLGRDTTGALQVESISQPGSDNSWNTESKPDSSFLIDARRLTPGQGNLVFRDAQADTFGDGVRLRLSFEDTASHLRVTRSYAAFPESPAVEAWSTFEADPAVPNVPVSDIGIWQAAIPATEAEWLTGLAPAGEGGRFTRRQQPVAPHVRLDLGATGRSSMSAIPAISLEGSAGHVLTGLLWSGAWGLSVDEPDATGRATVRVSLGTIATTVRLGETFDTPHAFLGISGPGAMNLAAAWQAYVKNGVLHGRPLDPQVTYNTWFAHGTYVDESTVRAEMDRAAEVGIDLFVLDAGWFPGGSSPSDYTTGLGTWTVDARRFPSGLGALRDYAHSHGLKFGVWVEPERVDTATINRPGLAKERFLATTNGRYNAGVKNESAGAAQICLADGEARQWVFDELVRFLDSVQPDYLKWDNNYWINCDRSGHGHGEKDANLLHTQALYGMLAGLRERYPNLSIENCGSGGNRMDFGMLQYSDAAWMDDVSGPSSHVRHNLEGLTTMFPPAYLVSFVMDDPAEPIHQAPDLEAIIRSRMPGVLGFSIRFDEFQAAELAVMRREVLSYRRTRPVMREAIPVLLSEQVDDAGSSASDSLEFVSSSSGDATAYLFAGKGQTVSSIAWPLLLDPNAVYAVGGRGSRLQLPGSALMTDGLETSRGVSAARVVQLSRQP